MLIIKKENLLNQLGAQCSLRNVRGRFGSSCTALLSDTHVLLSGDIGLNFVRGDKSCNRQKKKGKGVLLDENNTRLYCTRGTCYRHCSSRLQGPLVGKS